MRHLPRSPSISKASLALNQATRSDARRGRIKTARVRGMSKPVENVEKMYCHRCDWSGKWHEAMSSDDFYKFLYDFYTALGFFTKSGGSWSAYEF